MRGEGNHKIPASFAPENMEKTGAERVKYSLACQHEDAIPIKFVPYAQKCPTVLCTFAVALRKESVDRNTSANSVPILRTMSLSARRAWIEIQIASNSGLMLSVALRKESVDRNGLDVGQLLGEEVALRKESVDRNTEQAKFRERSIVALRKESVDRNSDHLLIVRAGHPSLSARRAWIEILRWLW